MGTFDNYKYIKSDEIISAIENLEDEMNAHLFAVSELFDNTDPGLAADINKGLYEPSTVRKLISGMSGDELDNAIEVVDEWENWEKGYFDELEALRELVSDCENSPDWEYGATLIHDDVFTDYAEATARSTCSGEFGSWPLNTIDWTHAAEVLQDDYMQVEYNGETYWVRA